MHMHNARDGVGGRRGENATQFDEEQPAERRQEQPEKEQERAAANGDRCELLFVGFWISCKAFVG